MDIVRNRDKVAIKILQKYSKQQLTIEKLKKIRSHVSQYDDKINELLDPTGVDLAQEFFCCRILGEAVCDALSNIATNEHVDLIFEILEYFDDTYITEKAAKFFIKVAEEKDWPKVKELQSANSACLRSFAYNAMYKSGKKGLYTDDLVKALYDDNDNIAREACWMLEQWEVKDKIDDVVRVLQRSNDNIKFQALSTVKGLGNRQYLKYVKPFLESEDQDLVNGAWRVFEKFASDEELLQLNPSFKSKKEGFGSHAVTTYENRATRQHIEEIIIPKLSNENEYQEACYVLSEAGENLHFRFLLPLLGDDEKALGIYHTASKLVGENNIPDILPLLKSSGWNVRRCACWLLRDIGKSKNILDIYPLTKDKNNFVSYSAYESIQKIAQRSFGDDILFKYNTWRFRLFTVCRSISSSIYSNCKARYAQQ